MKEGSEAHWEVVERILFIYAKLNPGQGYVQGMNEIVGPIYHTFAMDPDTSYRGFENGFITMRISINIFVRSTEFYLKFIYINDCEFAMVIEYTRIARFYLKHFSTSLIPSNL